MPVTAHSALPARPVVGNLLQKQGADMTSPSPECARSASAHTASQEWVLLQYPMQVQPVGASAGQYHMQADEQQSDVPPVKSEGTG